MTTPISIDQWQQLRQQGHTDQVIAQHYHIAQAQAPALPAPSAPQQRGAIDLSDGKFGVAEGRHPEDGRHRFKITGFDQHVSHRDGIPLVIIEYQILESTNPGNEIGGQYSKAYATRARANDYGKSRDALKGLLADLAKVAIPGCRPEAMASVEWNATWNAVVDGKGIGIEGVLSTRTTKTESGFDFVIHDWAIGSTAPIKAGPPTLAAPPPLPPPSVPPGPPALPGAPPPMPAPGLPPSIPGAPGSGLGLKPPGWQGAWPPGSDGSF